VLGLQSGNTKYAAQKRWEERVTKECHGLIAPCSTNTQLLANMQITA